MKLLVTIVILVLSSFGESVLNDPLEDTDWHRLNEDENSPGNSNRIKRNSSIAPPNEGQTSLVIVFDDTTSMYDDVEQLRDGAKKIVKEFANRDHNNPIYDYILVRFNDPIVRPVIKTSKSNEFLKALDDIRVGNVENYDCPEMAMQGIIDGMTVALPRSQVFVFTDDQAKDIHLLDKAIKIALAKQISVSFLVSENSCNPNVNFAGYGILARRSNGILYNVAKTHVEAVVKSIAEVLDTGLMPMEQIYSDTAGNHNISLTVDKSINKIAVTLAGGDPTVKITDPEGKRKKDVRNILNLPEVKMVAVDYPASGIYQVFANSSTAHMIKITGSSDIRLRYGFSYILPEELSDTAPSPIKDIPNYLSLFVWRNENKHTFTTAELVVTSPRTEFSHSNHSLKVLDPANCDSGLCIYVTDSFIPPLDTFKIYIRGVDTDGLHLKYLVSNNIEAIDGDSMKPKVTVNTKEINVKEDENLQLVCKVKSAKRAVIGWFFENKAIVDSSTKRVNFKRNDTVHLDFFGITLDDMGSYFCHAKNPYGQHHEKVIVKVEEIPWDIQMVETEMQSIENDSDFEIKCNISPPQRKINLNWEFNGEILTDSEDIKILENSLKLTKVNRRNHGKYKCFGVHNGVIKDAFGNLTVFYQPEIQGPTLEELVVSFGEKIVMNCSADGNPKPNIKWIREDGKPSNHSIAAFSPEDYGTHICEASNEIGRSAKKYINIETKYGLKPKVQVEKHTISVLEDDYLEIVGRVASPKPFKFGWNHYNGTTIELGGTFSDVLKKTDFEMKEKIKVKLARAQLWHSGEYVFSASNDFGKDEERVSVDVKPLPLKISMKETSMRLRENEKDFVIECNVLPSKRKLNLKWMFGDRVLQNSTEFELSGNKLFVKNMSRSYTGNVTCIGEFRGDIQNSTGKLNVVYPPEIIGPKTEKIVVKFDDKIFLKCSTNGNPKPLITWSRAKLTSEEMTIEKFTPSHYGEHICSATNGVGQVAQKTFFLDGKAKGQPELIHSDYYHEVKSNKNLTLKCGCKNCGPIKYSVWWKVDASKHTEIKNISGEMDNASKNYQFDLQLTNLRETDSSVYMCIIGNEFGIARETMRVIVTEGPVITEIEVDGAERMNDELIRAHKGVEVMLICKVIGSPNPYVRWYKNGNRVPISSSFMDNIIRFKSLSENDFGKYTCQATNKRGSTSKDVMLFVIQSIIPMNTIILADERQTVSLACESKNWLFNDEPLNIKHPQYTIIENTLIFDATYKDSGVYKCVMEHGRDTSKDFETVLMVQTAPIIMPGEDETIRVQKGREAILKCTVRGNPLPKINWKFNGKKLDNSLGIKNLKGGGLIITNANEKHSGSYICRAENEVGYTERATNLIVGVPPKITSEFDEKINVRFKDSVKCFASGSPKPEINWMFDGKVLEKTEPHSLNLHYNMRSGNYTCLAWNFAGEDKRSIFVEARGPPTLNQNYSQTIHHLIEGSDLILLCPIIDAVRVNWYQDGLRFPDQGSGDKNLFVIPSAMRDSAGTYMCVGENDAGVTNFTQYVRILPSDDPFIYGDHFEQMIPESSGANLILECKDREDMFERTKWVKDGRTVSMTRELVLNNLSFKDSGKYQCKDWHETGLFEQSYFVLVSGSPELLTPQENWLAIKEGANMELECLIISNPIPRITWEKDGKVINETTTTILSIEKVNATASGTYKCTGENELGESSIVYHVEILLPPTIDVLSDKVNLAVTDDLTLSCNATGNPLPVLLWTFNGSKLIGSEAIRATKDSINYKTLYLDLKGNVSPRPEYNNQLIGKVIYNKNLIIFKITIGSGMWSAGSYECNAVNMLGSRTAEVKVEVIDSPPNLMGHENETSITTLAGLPLFLPCPWKNDGVTTVSWREDTKTRDITSLEKELSYDKEIFSLSRSKMDDSGHYMCSARNRAGHASKDYYVEVKEPQFYTINSNRDDIVLKCPPVGNDAYRIVWDETLLGDRENTTSDLMELSPELPISHGLQSSIVACYHQSAESDERVKKLEVQILKTSSVAYFEVIRTVNIGDTISIRCPLVLEDHRLRVYWFKDGYRLLKASYEKNGRVLKLKQVKKEDEGTYRCQTQAEDFQRAVVLRTKQTIPSWSQWSSWSECSKSCAKGIKTRLRKCAFANGEKVDNRSLSCPGESYETQICNDFECPRTGGWGPWSKWSSCPDNCVNTTIDAQPRIKRIRTCTSPPPFMGGGNCIGASYEEAQCKNDPCPIDGKWSAWSEWSECSVTCGRGRRNRRRLCDSPAPQYGGEFCKGRHTQLQICTRPECPESTDKGGGHEVTTVVPSGWSAWSAWSSCSATCGSGYQMRYRHCKNPERCAGDNVEHIPCIKSECSV